MIPKPKKRVGGYTIIVGCGRLGANLANTLYELGEYVTIIDSNPDTFRRLSPSFKGTIITGDATEMSVLSSAKIKRASTVISVTNNDNTNVMVAQLAKHWYDIKNVVARLYDSDMESVYREFGIDIICPAVLSAKEIEKLLTEYDLTSSVLKDGQRK